MRRVLEPLVAVNDQSGHVFLLCKCLGEGLEDQLIVVTFAKLVGHNLVIEEVFHCREIQPALAHPVLSHIRHPFLAWFFGCEISLKQIISYTLGSLVCHIKSTFPANAGLKTELLHKAQYLLVIHPYTFILPQEQLDLPVAIPSFVAFIHRADESFSLGVSIVVLPLQICVVTTSRDAKELAVFSYLADVCCLFNELEALFFPSCIQISKHFFSIVFSRFNC